MIGAEFRRAVEAVPPDAAAEIARVLRLAVEGLGEVNEAKKPRWDKAKSGWAAADGAVVALEFRGTQREDVR